MLNNSSFKANLVRGGAWAFAGKIVTVLVGLLLNALLARLLSPEEMGVYFLIFSVAMFTAIFSQLGLNNTIVRLVAESMGTNRPSRARYSVALVLKIVVVSALLVACFLTFGMGQWIAEALFHSTIMGRVMGLVAIWVVVMTLQQLIAEIFRGFHDIRQATIFGGLITSVFSMVFFGVLWLTHTKGELDQILIITLSSGLISVLISGVVLWDKLSKLPLTVCKTLQPTDVITERKISVANIFRISWPLWITNLTVFVLVQADFLIMGFFGSSEDIAIYGAASRTVALVAIPLLIVNAVIAPVIAEMYAQGNNKKLERILRFMASISTIFSLCVFAAFAIFGGKILGMLFGGYYQAGWFILVILSVGQVVNVWGGASGLVLMLTGHQMTMMVISLVSGLVTIVAALLLVRGFQGFGVAMASAGGVVMQNLLMLFFTKKQIGIWTMADFSVMGDKSVWKQLIR